MHPLVIEETDCPVCRVSKRDACTRGTCGARMADFIENGALGSRLLIHLVFAKGFHEEGWDSRTPLWITPTEEAQWNAGGDAAIDMLFETIDEWCLASRFDLVVDEFLAALVPEKLNPTILAGALAITAAAKPHLKNRAAYGQAIREHLTRTIPLEVEDLHGPVLGSRHMAILDVG